MTAPYIKNWKLREGYPDDPQSIKDIEEMSAENGNGWWWYKNASDKAMTELTPSERRIKKSRGGSLSNNGGRRGL
tara:strand:- start:307 stop:531 length:225 start_codon:yes stop_codon:yes gene_type:complete